jgi:dihydrofolate synthase/folylpolyglutamate synthase
MLRLSKVCLYFLYLRFWFFMIEKQASPSPHASLSEWLHYLEGLHPSLIDMGLERVKKVARQLALDTPAVKIVVAGTNGKGSTCAMLESILLAAGYRVGLYTSPHLIDFNERARIQGDPLDDATFIAAFVKVDQARLKVNESLTYFEFTTLAVLHIFAQANLDVMVLEVGLGGRLDAVNIVDADCSIVTSIDLDHMEYLGHTRDKIGFEKAHVFRPHRPAICADPVPPQSLLDYAHEIESDLWLIGRDFNYSGDKQQWAFAGRGKRRSALAYPALRGANQLLNAAGALAALDALGDRLAVPQQAVRQGLIQAALPGRFQILPGQPTVVLDVAHNPHAAAVLEKNISNMGFAPYTYAVFGMLADKNIEGVVQAISPRIDGWFCADLPGPRGLTSAALAKRIESSLVLTKDQIETPPTVEQFESPEQAYAQALVRANPNDRIIVFGSFLTVAAILQSLNKRPSKA